MPRPAPHTFLSLCFMCATGHHHLSAFPGSLCAGTACSLTWDQISTLPHGHKGLKWAAALNPAARKAPVSKEEHSCMYGLCQGTPCTASESTPISLWAALTLLQNVAVKISSIAAVCNTLQQHPKMAVKLICFVFHSLL